MSKTEGWTWVYGFIKWHYFRGYRSLCGKAEVFVHPSEGYYPDGVEARRCSECLRRREKERSK